MAVLNLIPREKRSAEQTAEHTTLQELIPKVEVRFQESLAALRAEQETGTVVIDAEARELDATGPGGRTWATYSRRRSRSGRPPAKRAELQTHFGLGSHQVPLEMLRLNRGVEERVAAVVPASIADASQGRSHYADFRER